MKNFIKHAIDELTSKNPNWDVEVSDYLNNDTEIGKESFDQLTEVLFQIVSQIRDEKIGKDDLDQLFADYQQYKSFIHMKNFVWNRISIYADYSLLRNTCQSDKYMAQKIVDIIWDEKIYRFNPYLTLKEKLKIDVDDAEYDNLANSLNKYVIRSVKYSLTYDAIVESLKKDSDLPDEICRYIARKIDENMTELKINYILGRLMVLDDRIDLLLSDESTEE